MEAKRYRAACRLVDQLSPHRRSPGQLFGDREIVKVYLFATESDRPVSWACKSQHWPEPLLDQMLCGNLPSQPTMSRRIRTVGVQKLLERVQLKLGEMLQEQDNPVVKAIDSKPLRVSRYSKDVDARNGRAAGDMSRGYKVHVITAGKAFLHWTLAPMNVSDQTAAADLLPRLDAPGAWGYVSADNGYDSNKLHGVAEQINHQLLAPPRRSNAHVRDTRRNCAGRIRALDLFADPLSHCGQPNEFAQSIINDRDQIERNFGNAAMHGLNNPPPWVRTPRRVASWTSAKLIQTMVRTAQIKGLMK